MGCVNGKQSSGRSFQKLKPEHGYATRGSGGARPLSRSHNNVRAHSKVGLESETRGHRVSTSRNENAGGAVVRLEAGAEREQKNEVGINVSKRFVDKKIGRDEYVGGWPKWLVDNIPADVLAKLLPKSADSYEMLAKVVYIVYTKSTYSLTFEVVKSDLRL